jgi:hypothetical protein
MGFPKKCVEEFGTFVHLERYSTTTTTRGDARKNRLLQFREFSYNISHVG